MEGLCPVPQTGGAFLSGTLAYIDCQAQSLAASGYQALASPGSVASILLTALLSLFIAIIGIRLLMGHVLGSGELIGIGLKLGIVLALASSWAAYRVAAYDLVLKGPAELVGAIGGPAGLPGAEGGLVARLQGVDNGIVAFIVAGSGRFDLASTPAPGAVTLPASRTPVSDDVAFGTARTLYLSATLMALGFVRIVAGLLLAIGPLVAGLLLFEGTRGLFFGWVRMLVASLLGGVAVALVLALQLGLMEPWLAGVLAERAARIATPAAPMELLAMTFAFAAILVGVLAMAVRIAFAADSPAWLQQGLSRLGGGWTREARTEGAPLLFGGNASSGQDRADRIAEAVLMQQRRETHRIDRTEAGGRGAGGNRVTDAVQPPTSPNTTPLGQSYRRTASRASASGTIRSTRR